MDLAFSIPCPVCFAKPLVLLWLARSVVNAASIGAVSAALDLPSRSSPVEVRASFHLLGLQHIDDEEETFEFSGILTLEWKDPRQAFDPSKAGVEEKLTNGTYQLSLIPIRSCRRIERVKSRRPADR